MVVNIPVHKYIPGVGIIWVNVPTDLRAYFQEKQDEREGLWQQIQSLIKRLSNASFVAKAPSEIVEQTHSKMLDLAKQYGISLRVARDNVTELRKQGIHIRFGA